MAGTYAYLGIHLLVNFVTIQNHMTRHCTLALLRIQMSGVQIWLRPSDVTEAILGLLNTLRTEFL
jgi:hypothetical protein